MSNAAASVPESMPCRISGGQQQCTGGVCSIAPCLPPLFAASCSSPGSTVAFIASISSHAHSSNSCCSELFLAMEHGCRDPVDPAPLARALNLGGCSCCLMLPVSSWLGWHIVDACRLPRGPTLQDCATHPASLCLLPVSPALSTMRGSRWASSSSKPPSCVLSSSLPCAHCSADHAVQQDGQEFMKLFLTLLEARFSQQEELRDIIQARRPAQRGPQCSIPPCTQFRWGCNAAISVCSHWCRMRQFHWCLHPNCLALAVEPTDL